MGRFHENVCQVLVREGSHAVLGLIIVVLVPEASSALTEVETGDAERGDALFRGSRAN